LIVHLKLFKMSTKINTIHSIEKFIENVLVSSPLIPLAVQILRLSDVIENEGVVNQANTIVISYAGTSTTSKQREPVVTEKNISFELKYICQSYLSNDGYNFALSLLEAVYNLLTGITPNIGQANGFKVIEGFRMVNENPTGITDNSQYTYSQTWEIVTEDISSEFILDPCVKAGDCSKIWPPPNVLLPNEKLEFWEVLNGNRIFSSQRGLKFNEDLGVIYCDNSEIFIPLIDIDDTIVLSTNSFTAEEKLVVRLYRISTGELIREEIYDFSGKFVSQINLDFFRSSSDFRISQEISSKDCLFSQNLFNQGTEPGITNSTGLIISDPLNSDPQKRIINSGTRLDFFPDIILSVKGINWRLTSIKETPWINDEIITKIEIIGKNCES